MSSVVGNGRREGGTVVSKGSTVMCERGGEGSGVSMAGVGGGGIEHGGGVRGCSSNDGGCGHHGSVVGSGTGQRRGCSGFVGGNRGAESGGVGDVVHGTHTAVGVTESIGTDFDSKSVSRLPTERSAAEMTLIVSESVVSESVFGSVLA